MFDRMFIANISFPKPGGKLGNGYKPLVRIIAASLALGKMTSLTSSPPKKNRVYKLSKLLTRKTTLGECPETILKRFSSTSLTVVMMIDFSQLGSERVSSRRFNVKTLFAPGSGYFSKITKNNSNYNKTRTFE